MKLQRLRVAELRQFRAPFELADLQPGLNIFSGPNEAGKSTLVRAIRAAFFERHRSTSVDDLRPYGDSAATPQVEIDFETGGTVYRLRKSFLHKKRCELLVGSRALEGVEAEDFLAEMLGFEFAGKGASQEKHWGIPGLLWIEQGAGHAVRDAVVHASDHLRRALDASLGTVAASGGDDITAQVQALKDELLTGTGKPRAAYQKAIDDSAALQQRVAALQAAVDGYRQQVDQLKGLRDAHLQDQQDQPWAALRTEQAAAQAALQAVESLRAEREREHEALRQTSGLRTLLAQRLQAAAQQREQLAARETALAAAGSGHEQAAALEAQAVAAEATVAARLQAARAALALARQEDTRATLQRQRDDARTRAADLAAQLQRAGAEHARATALQREAAQGGVAARDLAALRAQGARLQELQIRQAAVATRLRFDLLPGAALRLTDEAAAGEALAGLGERLLVAPSTLQIDGVGQLHIAPGGSDLADLAAEHAQLQDTHQALLQRLGLATLADAEARDRAQAQRLADAEAAAQACRLLAPQGLDALRLALDTQQARQAEADAALARLPAAPADSAALPPIDQAEHQHEAARDAADAAGRQLQATRQALATAASQLDAARRERDALQALLADPALQAELAGQQRALVEAGAHEATLAARLQEIDTRIAAARPDILRQDVERLRRSAEQLELQHQARDRQIAQLEAALGAAGAQGLEEELARQQAELAQAERRRDELQRRAEALQFLLQRLDQRRQALTQRLQAPLQQHLDHYLQLLFPDGRLAVDEQLVPGALTRHGPRGPEAGDFDTLSFGAREQMGLISRLAYADLLQAAGRPTLLILDDALVHSDEARLQQMKRVLFDAAQRHQVLLFTCHPAQWRDMGVPLRALESLR